MISTSLSSILSETGYLVCRQRIEQKTIGKMRNYLEERLENLKGDFCQWYGISEQFTNDHYRLHSNQLSRYDNLGLPKSLRHFLTGEFDLGTRLSEEVREFMSMPSLKQVIAEVWGNSNYFFHHPPMLRFKVPEAAQTIVPPHQDIAYNSHLPSFISVWIPMTPITDEIEGVIFYKGTQTLEKLPHNQSGAWASKISLDESLYMTHSPKMEPGDVLFFNPYIVHSSGVNKAKNNSIRFSFDGRIFSQQKTSKKAYYDPFSKKVYNGK